MIFFSAEVAGSFANIESLEDVENFFTKTDQISATTTTPTKVTHVYNTRISFLSNRRNLTLTYQYNFGTEQITKVKRKVLLGSAGNTSRLVYLAEQAVRVKDLTLERDTTANIAELSTLLSAFSLSSFTVRSVEHSPGAFSYVADYSVSNFPDDTLFTQSLIDIFRETHLIYNSTNNVLTYSLGGTGGLSDAEEQRRRTIAQEAIAGLNNNIQALMRLFILEELNRLNHVDLPKNNPTTAAQDIVKSVLNNISLPAFRNQTITKDNLSISANNSAGVILNGTKLNEIISNTSFVTRKNK